VGARHIPEGVLGQEEVVDKACTKLAQRKAVVCWGVDL